MKLKQLQLDLLEELLDWLLETEKQDLTDPARAVIVTEPSEENV